jgi:hypothetical protein
MFVKLASAVGIFWLLPLGPLFSGRSSQPIPLEKLLKARLDAARKAFGLTWERYREHDKSPPTIEAPLSRWSKRWLEAQRALAATKADHKRALEEHRDRMMSLEAHLKDRAKTAPELAADVAAAEFFRLEAEVWVRQTSQK